MVGGHVGPGATGAEGPRLGGGAGAEPRRSLAPTRLAPVACPPDPSPARPARTRSPLSALRSPHFGPPRFGRSLPVAARVRKVAAIVPRSIR